MNVENIWQTLVFAVAIFGAYAIFALGWPVGRVADIGLAEASRTGRWKTVDSEAVA